MFQALNKLERIIPLIAFLLLLYHLIYIFYILQGATYHYITHFGACLIFLLLSNAASNKNSRNKRIICIFLIFMTLVPSLYIYINAYDLAMNFGFINNMAIFMGFLLIFATIFTAWMIWGPILPIITVLFVLYFFFGHNLPQPFYHREYNIGYVVSYLCAGTNSGIFGYLLPVSANFLFLLLSMGGIFIAVRLLPAFLEGGKALGNLAKTGPAYGAVVASSLFGMVSGAAAGNAAFTGTFTIPTMKSRGFSGADAAGIEATASNGGQLMPPIMAATAFIMAAFIGRSLWCWFL